jgi:hypothetical protein
MADFHREACRRQHGMLGQYLAMQAWVRGLECIVLQRRDLEYFLGLERFKSTRVQWLREDLTPWFPHQEAHHKTGAPSSIHSLYLSRVSMGPHLPPGSMTVDVRLQKMSATAPKTEMFLAQGPWRPPTEQAIVSQLAVISAGLAVPQDYPAKRRIK